MAAGRVGQVTAIHRFNIRNFGRDCSLVTVITGSTVYTIC